MRFEDKLNSNTPEFPCSAVPEEGRVARFLGLYDQRQQGLLMQRIKITGGRLEPAQWRKIAELAQQFTPGEPLRLTTRQDVEFHGLRPEGVPALQRGLAEAGLTTVGACGDTIRAVTVDPESGLAPGSYDMGPLAALIHEHAQAFPEAFGLPRKFKISLSGSPDGKARPFINDVALVANADGTLRAVVAGSLGARPIPGILFSERLEPEESFALITAALRLFAAEGDRTNRSRARLRHVRERLGDEAFCAALQKFFDEEKTKPQPPVPVLTLNTSGSEGSPVVLHLPGGALEASDALLLANLAEERGAILRIGLEHDLWLFGIDAPELPEGLQKLTATTAVAACPGAHLCSRGITETWGAAAALRAAIPAGSGLFVAISGCPNGCSHPAIADIGLIGRLKKTDGEQRPHYRLLAGGGRGTTPKLATELHAAVPLEQVGVVAAWLVEQWNQALPNGDKNFASFIEREQERLRARIESITKL